VPLSCPSCGRTIAIKDPKPGRFRIPCPECGQPFVLRVGDDARPSVTSDTIETTPESADLPSTNPDPWTDARQLASRVLATLGQRLRWAWRALIDRQARIGGTLILEELGRTSRGNVARGRQVLIGRHVLIRTLPADWGGPDPITRASASRLAHVSGNLVHPNLVSRFEFGMDKGRRFVIEEALQGPTLAVVADREEWVGGDAAIAPVLHAARGLKAAHDQGLAHGDPSPDHLWLDAGGVVKLAGIGLSPTSAPASEGSEPWAITAARDVQILGTTLDTLARKRPGGDAQRPALALDVAARMKAAGTPDGYRDLGEAILALEAALGMHAGGSFLPKEGDERRLADLVAQYHEVPLAPLRSKLLLGFVAVCVGFVLLFARAGNFALAGGVLGLIVLTGLIYSLVRAGLSKRAGLLGRARELLLGGRRADWLTVLAAAGIGIGVLFLMGWLAGWIALGIVASLLAVGFLVAVDAPIERDRKEPLDLASALLAEMRGRGVAETDLREFVCKFGGKRWDEMFEALFGLDALRAARSNWGKERPGRFRLDAWKFPVLDWLDARLRDRSEARARDSFERLEEAALIAQKVNDMTARRRARRIAEALIIVGREVLDVSIKSLTPDSTSATIRVIPRPIPDLLREAVQTPDRLLTSTWSDERDQDRGPNPLVRLLAALTGPRVRFLLGGLLFAGFLLWADQVGIISSREIRDRAQMAIAERDVTALKTVNLDLERAQADEPLVLPHVPPALTRPIVGYGVGAAALILIASAFVPGSRIAFFALPGAAIAWFGPRWGIPAIAPLPAPAVASAIGAGLLAIGLLLPKRR
jgi:eukaryotic-like serine/threonine-protein kinase